MSAQLTVQLNVIEVEYLSRPIEGNGGFQKLLKRLQAGLDRSTETLVLSMVDADTLLRYAKGYGSGGWQGRLSRILPIVEDAFHAEIQARARRKWAPGGGEDKMET